MEARKIAIACFIGGAICCAFALMVAPVLWWFGMIAGFAGGYVTYELREVLRAIPVALCAAGKGSSWVWRSLVDVVEEYFKKPHPFAHLAAIIAIPFWYWLVSRLISEISNQEVLVEGIVFNFFLVILMPIAFVEMAAVASFPIVFFAFIGARVGERSYWVPMEGDNLTIPREEIYKRIETKGLKCKPLSYRNAYRWITKGIGITALFFVWTLWKHLAIGMWKTLLFFGRFAWYLFKLIHSQKRVLCGIDSALGGALAYVLLQSMSYAVGEQMMLIVFGGLLGSALGVVNWEIVSKRLLNVGAEER